MRSLGIRVTRPALCGLCSSRLLTSLLVALFVLWPSARLQGQTASAVSSSTIPVRIVERVDETNLVTIQGNTHPAVHVAIDKGRLPSTLAMGDLFLVLKRSEAQQAALDRFNAEQYDPSSPEFHHWLTPEEFGAAYGVSQTDLDTVSNWLLNHGFTIQEIPASHTEIRFSGTAGQVEAAFHTEMHSIEFRGETHIANMSDIRIPAALTPVVVGVKSLHNFFPKAQHRLGPLVRRDASGKWTPVNEESRFPKLNLPSSLEARAPMTSKEAGPRPEFGVTYSGSQWELLVPYDMATIYNYKSLWNASSPINGAGQTIAIAGRSNIVLSDVATFRSATGLPAKAPSVIVTNSDPGTTALLDDRMENTLDVEWSGAAAPGATIKLVISSQETQSTDPAYLSESYIVNHSVAKIMSASYGECELGMGTAGNQLYANLWNQAYTAGIAVFVSTGDSGAASCDMDYDTSSTEYAAEWGLTVSGIASTPYNVAVGGTDFNWTISNFSSTNSSNLSNALGYIPEVPWNGTIANPIVVDAFNNENGVNYDAEVWANLLLEAYQGGQFTLAEYESLISPVGGSGGVSACTTSSGGNPTTCSGGYAKPAWQSGVTGISSSNKRTIPDVSFFASNGFLGSAYLICDTLLPSSSPSGTPMTCDYTNSSDALAEAVGGTSVSSPVMAGIMALINQKAGSSQGNPNSVLYGLAAKQSYANCKAESVTNSSACYFNDIDTGNIEVPCFVGSTNCTAETGGDTLAMLPGYAATAGYDKATGLGSLNVANVVNAWPSTTPTAPVASLSPGSLTFASTNVGSSATAQTVTLKNTGTAALTISGITLTGAAASSYSKTTTCGSSLAVSASCTVAVTFKPMAAGSLKASLSFADNAANSPQTVALTGTGTSPVVSLSTTRLTFAGTRVGTAAATQTITLTNTGTGALSLSGSGRGIAIAGTNANSFSQTNTCGANVAAGANCKITVTFKPKATGALTAQINLADNAANTPQSVTLKGTGQ